ncbi:ATP-NAD kinase-like domain-containing protein [Phlebopus sp. FC_14]|nr:ATP-NAD kinase-like domain-containing protein [Phlebopus sp. FC_14]
MSVLVIYNPVCGDGTAKQFFEQYVIPYLKDANITPTSITATGSVGDAGAAVIKFLANQQGDVTVILGSGDGTLHEIINAMASDTSRRVRDSCPSVRMVLVPCGTANALYASFFTHAELDPVAYKLQSLKAFASGSVAKALTLAFTSLSGSSTREPTRPEVVVSAVVTSTALHAAILDDSENLRQQYPGIERFKVAAQQNITRWYNSRVKLFPLPSSGVVHIYDPERRTFVSHKDSDEGNPIMDLYGPFAYFLSTVNVDRLEPAFRICPMILDDPPQDASLDVIVIRPRRNPTFSLHTPQAREEFATTTFAVLMEVYRNGNHINLRYKEDGDTTDSGLGPVVVEYFRCGGWEWIPDDADERAHLLCSDGAIFRIDEGGRAVCRAARPTDNTAVLVYA